jgi:undecaprenyl diphosphate synthase
MDLFLFILTREIKRFTKYKIRFSLIGDISQFSDKLQRKIREVEELTKDNDALVLSVAANYGGRWDIVQATKQLVTKVQDGQLTINDINENELTQCISLANLPPLDLLIRTGGDFRISNFLLWQAAYAELYFTDTLWPDFDEAEFETAVRVFAQRERRFGKTSEQANNNNL